MVSFKYVYGTNTCCVYRSTRPTMPMRIGSIAIILHNFAVVSKKIMQIAIIHTVVSICCFEWNSGVKYLQIHFSHSNLINYARFFLCYLLFASRFRRCCCRFRNKMSFKQTPTSRYDSKVCANVRTHTRTHTTHLLGYSNDKMNRHSHWLAFTGNETTQWI